MAARKVQRLLACQADVHLISPALCSSLEALRVGLRWSARDYLPGDLAGAALAVAATDSVEVNQAVWREARERGVWVNVVDDPDLCDFHLPSVLQRGSLTVTVSTSGTCPALSRKLRQDLEDSLPPTYAVYVELLAEARRLVHSHTPSEDRRRDLLRGVLEMPVDLAGLADPREVEAMRDRIRIRVEDASGRRPSTPP